MKRFATAAPRRSKNYDIWQVFYIDLITNLMMFFVVLWVINEHQTKGISQTLGEETVKMVNLPGDVLFASGKSELTTEGREVFGRLFNDETGQVLNFDTGGLVKRLLVIHGHTDSEGEKDHNLELGYLRAMAAYREIRKYGEEVTDHVVICAHADNSPSQEVPAFAGVLSRAEDQAVREAMAKNRRITIEDKLVNKVKAEEQ